MAITAKTYSDIYTITESEQTALEATHAEGHLGYLAIHPEDNPFVAGVLKEIKDLQKEIDYLRTEIDANKNKNSFPGFGNKNGQALAGDTTTISTSQASAITANTAKTSMSLGTSSTTALAGDTKLVGIGSNTTLAFGDLTSTTDPKSGKVTYSITLAATRDFGGKTGIQTKSTTIPLT